MPSSVCRCCKGSKIQHLTVMIGAPGKPDGTSTMDVPCVWCGGTGEMTPRQLAIYVGGLEIWCRCGNHSGQVTFHDDTPNSKHHWTCDDCGKVMQIG